MTALSENLERLEEAIGAACRAAGRARSEVELMAVSKTFPAEAVAEAAALGLTLFGENRVQEFNAKVLRAAELGTWAVRERLRFHLIGHLQSNKAARAAEIFDGVDSLDSVRLAERLNEAAGKYGQAAAGADRSEAEPGSDEGRELSRSRKKRRSCWSGCQILLNLEMRGLMTIAPWGAPEDVTRACFRRLRMWRDRWAAAHPRSEVSMFCRWG